MKKTLCILLVGIFTSGLTFAGFHGPTARDQISQRGGFKGNYSKEDRPTISTVKDVLSMWDGSRATIEGNIIRQDSKDKYLFQDSTGQMIVKIKHKYWQGKDVTPKDIVRLSGKVDVEKDFIKLDVKAPVITNNHLNINNYHDTNYQDINTNYQDTNTSKIQPIKRVKSMPDNTWTTIKGTITGRAMFDDDDYTLKDSTGEITVEIDDDFGPISIGSTYEITGKIDNDWNKPTKLEAKSINRVR